MIRRRFLQLSALAVTAATAGYSAYRGIRFPPFIWDPEDPRAWHSSEQLEFKTTDLISTPNTSVADSLHRSDFALRAYAPEPSITILAKQQGAVRLAVNNIASDAELVLSSESPINISESVEGITRYLEIALAPQQQLQLSWKLPSLDDGFQFAAIGDTGGGSELAWCIQRAHALGARFLLHLGDFNYQPSDYANSIKLFNNAPLPCYVSIGNHDFHDGGPVYHQFLDEIGPLNSQFSIGKTRFANIDTAANTLPYNAGPRGKLIKQLIAQRDSYETTIVYTHRPFYDPQPDSHHDMGSVGERDWLVKSLKQAGVQSVLSGHIHVFDRRDFEGLDNLIVGQGLGHQDLLTGSDYSKIALGYVAANGSVELQFKPLSMPMSDHCHPRVDPVKESLANSQHAELIKEIDKACDRT